MAECDYSSSLTMSHHAFTMATGDARARRVICGDRMTSPIDASASRRFRSCGGGAADVMESRDYDVDMEAGGVCGGRNGQWVTLSKSLLLQLVERICQLSFQPDATGSQSGRGRTKNYEPQHEQTSTATAAADRHRQSTRDVISTSSTPDANPNAKSNTDVKPEIIENVVRLDVNRIPEVAAVEQTDDCNRSERQTDICQGPEEALSDVDKAALMATNDRTSTVRTIAGDATSVSSSVTESNGEAKKSSIDASPERTVTTEVEPEVENNAVGAPDSRTGSLFVGTKRGPQTDSKSDEVDCKSSRLTSSAGASTAPSGRRRQLTRSRRRAAAASSRSYQRHMTTLRNRATAAAEAATCNEEVSSSQSWMALNKDIVLCAIEKELSNNNDGENKPDDDDDVVRPAATSKSGTSTTVTTIWNPATCTSRFESSQRCSTSEGGQSSLSQLSGGIWRTHVPSLSTDGAASARWPLGGAAAGTTDRGSSDGRRTVESNSSMLCALLGFDTEPSEPSLPPQQQNFAQQPAPDSSRQRHWSANEVLTAHRGGPLEAVQPPHHNFYWLNQRPEATAETPTKHAHHFRFSEPMTESVAAADAAAAADMWRRPVAAATSYASLQQSPTSNAFSVTSPNFSPDDTSSRTLQTLWRPTEPKLELETRRQMYVAKRNPPRWVVVSKGDVCLLVDSLVTTMIAGDGGAPGERHEANDENLIQHDSPDGVNGDLPSPTSEPRKWKSDLLLRVRNEKQ